MSRIQDFILFGIALLCFWVSCFARPKELGDFYRTWKPLELVRGLRSLSVDPFNVFRCLEAVKDLDSEEALDVMEDLDVRPITIYDALADLGVDPYDAYYALKAWLTDPLLHQPGDHYHRVNISGDPTHPFLHVAYKKCKTGDQSSGEYQARYMTSEEIERELKAIEQEYKESLDTGKIKMKEFIDKAKAVHSAFDDPAKVFNDFFGERHFEDWKNMFPKAFEGLKDIYKNPLGFSFRKNRDKSNETTQHDKVYQHLHKGREYVKKTKGTYSKDNSESSSSDAFRKFYDSNRYETLIDETRKENTGPADSGSKEGQTIIHHTKVFYDKLRKMYVECKQTEELVEQDSGTYRKVKSNVRYFTPADFEAYLKKKTAERQQQQQQSPQPIQPSTPHPDHPPPSPHPQHQPPPHPQPPSHPQPPPHPYQQPPPPHPYQQPPPHSYQQPPPHFQQHPPQQAHYQNVEQQPEQQTEKQKIQQEPQKSHLQQTTHEHPQPNPYQHQQPQHPQSQAYQQQQAQNQQPYPQQPPFQFYQHQPPYQQFYNYPPNQYYPQQNHPPQTYEQYPHPQPPHHQQEQRPPQYGLDSSGTHKDHQRFHYEQPQQESTRPPVQGQYNN